MSSDWREDANTHLTLIARDAAKPPRLRRGYNALSYEERMRFSLGATVCGVEHGGRGLRPGLEIGLT